MGVAALANMTALSKRNDSPETASRPFDATRDGFVLGEGGGVVVVESLAHALARGATPIAEILGGALTADAFHISAPEPTGRGQARAMTLALQRSEVAPDEIDYIVAHGTATPLNDVTETRAIKAAYGDARLQGRDQLAEVDDRPPRRGRRHRQRAGRRSGRSATRSSRRRPTCTRPDPECDLDYVPLTSREAQDRDGRRRRLRLRRPERGGHLPAHRRRTGQLSERPSNASIAATNCRRAMAVGRSVA